MIRSKSVTCEDRTGFEPYLRLFAPPLSPSESPSIGPDRVITATKVLSTKLFVIKPNLIVNFTVLAICDSIATEEVVISD
ncbi:hypothetical protein F0562_029650 [Nyssa sinensis]|uniref:Uncharacterized protein n=1 Tax=Nyssa sinensis TaxID=561372 RepID=A0A5J5B3K8_9ASTE|nr:hypothetical protein F0562_029650 [Nyssa sinensis]